MSPVVPDEHFNFSLVRPNTFVVLEAKMRDLVF